MARILQVQTINALSQNSPYILKVFRNLLDKFNQCVLNSMVFRCVSDMYHGRLHEVFEIAADAIINLEKTCEVWTLFRENSY